MKLFVFIFFTIWILLAAAQAELAPDEPGVSTTGEDYPNEEEKRLYFAPVTAQGNFTLRKYVDSVSTSWPLGPWSNLARSFLLGHMSINWDMVRNVIVNQQAPATSDILDTFKGIIFPLGLGLITGILFWFIGIIFCMCRICGNCGSELTLEDAEKQKRLWSYILTGILAFSCIMLFASACAIYSVGRRIPETGPYILNIAGRAIDDMVEFKDVLFLHLEELAEEDLEFAIDTINDEVENMAKTVTKKFMADIKQDILDIITALDNIQKDVQSIREGMDGIRKTENDIHQIDADMKRLRTKIQTNLDGINRDCTGLAFCRNLPKSNEVPAIGDFTKTPGLRDQMNLLNDAASLDLSDINTTVNKEYNGIPGRIHNETTDKREEIKQQFREVQDMISPMLDDSRKQVANLSTILADFREFVAEMAGFLVNDYTKLIPKVFMGVAFVVFIIVGFALSGLALGHFSQYKKPLPKDREKHGEYSYYALMVGVFLAWLFTPFFLIPGSILFGVGAPLTMLCEPVRDLSIFDEIVDDTAMWDGEYLLSAMLLGNGSIELKMRTVLEDCKAEKTLYTALKMHHLVDIADIVDIDRQMPDMSNVEKDVNRTILGMSLLNPEMFKNLTQVSSNTKGADVDAKALMNNIQADADKLNFNGFITQLQTVSATARSADQQGMADKLDNAVADAEAIQKKQVPLKKNVTLMTNQIADLSSPLEDLVGKSGDIKDKAKDFEIKLASSAGKKIVEGVQDFVNLIMSFAKQYINHVKRGISTDVGKCGLVWDFYDVISDSFCSFFLDCVNSFWLAMCMIGFFFVPFIICSILVTKYFRNLTDNQGQAKKWGFGAKKKPATFTAV